MCGKQSLYPAHEARGSPRRDYMDMRVDDPLDGAEFLLQGSSLVSNSVAILLKIGTHPRYFPHGLTLYSPGGLLSGQ